MASTEIRELRSRIGRAIRKLREEEGISAQYLAKVLGVTQSTISRIESGASSISAENLFFIAKSFNRPISFFVGEQSPTVHDIQDILRAGLVQYGATHLKAKRNIDIKEHYRTYEDFLNAALYEVDDPRFAAALATTIYSHAAKGKINELRLITSIKHVLLAQYLLSLITFIRKALPDIKRPSREKEKVKRTIENIRNKISDKYGPSSATHFPIKSSAEVALFINESMGHE
jgi:transcriptional regulator with XRE-family HTH domain